VFLRCLNAECITVEGTTRAIFDGVNKAITWPGAPVAPLEHPQPPERTTTGVFHQELLMQRGSQFQQPSSGLR